MTTLCCHQSLAAGAHHIHCLATRNPPASQLLGLVAGMGLIRLDAVVPSSSMCPVVIPLFCYCRLGLVLRRNLVLR